SRGTGMLAQSLYQAEQARLEAHQAYLRIAEGAADLIGKHLSLQLDLLAKSKAGRAIRSVAPLQRPSSEAVLYDRRECMELAIGSVAAVFGPEFEEVDRFPVRVRLPDEPLMLVDRILTLEGTPRSLGAGRIVTEHEVRPGAWYLDSARVAPCVA